VFAGINPSGFAQTNNCLPSLAVGASCKINVTLTPIDIGPRNAVLILTDSGTIGPQNVVLSAMVVAPKADLTPATPAFGNFGDQIKLTSSAPQPMTLRNTGLGPLAITNFNITGPQYTEYSQTNNCGATLAVGASCTINVIFTPGTYGVRTGILNARNAAGKQTLALTGTGITAVTLSVNSLAFAAQTRDTISAPMNVTITNPGSVPLSPVVTLVGTNPYDFGETTTCGAALAPHATCKVRVTFKPSIKTALGAKAATVIVTDRGTHQTVSLTGTAK
jgi:hypothetical protein